MTSTNEIEAEIRAQLAAQLEVKEGLDKLAEQVRDYWRSQSPVDQGEYAASVKIYAKYLLVDGMPGKRVGATDFKAHWVEFGTGEPGPTKAVAPRAKTAAHFGGDESRVDAIVTDENMSWAQRQAQLARFDNITIDLSGE